MSDKRSMLLSKFKSLFPDIYKDGMTVSEVSGVLWVNPTPGRKGRKYMFIYRPDGRWELHYE